MKDQQQIQRETSRWIVLVALYQGGGWPVAEGIILSTVQSIPLQTDASVIRAQLRYLESAGLCEIQKLPDGRMTASITQKGCDVYEYTQDCPAGIGRPNKYW